jgi:CelD/BcsL family acetyltransferase involved in cellulose biosynthesis
VLQRGLARTGLGRTLVLNRLPASSRLLEVLQPIARSSIFASVAAVALVAGFDAYLSALSGPTRNQIRRMEKRLAETGPVVMRNAVPESFDGDLDWILEHKRAWTPPGGRKLRDWIVLPGYERDVKDLGRKWIKSGQMTIGIIEAGGHRVAGGIVLATGGRSTFYLTTYDPEYAKVSPGRMLALWRLDHAARAGSTFFDFMAGRFEWKERLKTTDFDVLRLKVPLR